MNTDPIGAGRGGTDSPRPARRSSGLRAARFLALLVLAGGAAAALVGLFDRGAAWPAGQAVPPTLANAWGLSTALEGAGAYARDSRSFAVQERAQDLVTLVFGLPLLAAGLVLTRRPSRGGRLLLTGALGYFLYCYGMMAVGTAYNRYFLLYVGVFAASLQAFVLSYSSIDVDEVAEAVAGSFPRRGVAVLSVLVGLFLALNWLGGLVLPSLLGGRAPAGMDDGGTLFVQALDLGVLVPVAFLATFWLFRRDRRGYVLGAVLMVKGAAEGLAVAAMGLSMRASGIEAPLPLVLGFLALALAALALGALCLRSAGFVPKGG